MATCPTFPWERGSVCHIGRQLHWKKKKELLGWLLISFGFAAMGTSDKPQRSKKNKRRKKTQKIGEEGKLENAEEAGDRKSVV